MTQQADTRQRDLAAEFRTLHEAAKGCEFDLTPVDGPIALLTLFVHQHGDAILAALSTSNSSVMVEGK